MQRMSYTKGLSAPSASELETFDKLFDVNLTERWTHSSRTLKKARPGSHEDSRPPSRSHSYISIGYFLLCNIELRGRLLGWSNYDCIRSTSFDAR